MMRVIKGGLILFLVLLSSVWWIYSKCVNSNLQHETRDKWQQMEDNIRTKIEQDKRKKVETIANDMMENDLYPKYFRHIPEKSIRKKRNVNLRQMYENEQGYVKELKEKIHSKTTEEDRRSNIETIYNDIEEIENYPRDISHKPAFIQRKNKKDLGQANKDDKYLKKFKEMLQGDEASRLIKFEDDFLRSFITSNDQNIDKAFTKVQNFLKLIINHNYFFHNISFDFTQSPEYRFITILPHLRKDGSTAILFELAKWNPEKVPLKHLKQIMFITGMQALRNPDTQASGIHLIYDLADVGFRYVKFATPENIFLMHHVSYEVIPAKYLGIHVVNINTFGNILVTLMRPFIPKYIENIFYIHASAKELLDFFPPSMLPVQYGGNLTEYYAADWIRRANQQHGNYPLGGKKNTF